MIDPGVFAAVTFILGSVSVGFLIWAMALRDQLSALRDANRWLEQSRDSWERTAYEHAKVIGKMRKALGIDDEE